MRELLTHHSGLTGNIMEGFELKDTRPRGVPGRSAPARVLPPRARPGTVFAYCNAGFTLLGNLVEAAGATGYADTVRRGILEPLGMDDTRFFLAPSDAEGAAMGYEGRTRVPVYPMRDIPAGGLLSTAADMERFMEFVFDRGGSGVLGRDAFDEMVRRQNAGIVLDGDFSIGLGYWLIKPIDVEDAFASHAGDIPPFHSVLVTIPDRRIGVFLAANSSRDPSALVPLAVELVRAAYADETGRLVPERPTTPRIRLDHDTLASLAGRYASPLGLLDIRAANGRLLTRVNGFPVEIVPREDGTFTAELSLLGLASVPVAPLKKVRFSRLESGGRTYLAITALGIMAGVAEKLPAMEVPQAWKARTGRYAIVERNANGNYQLAARRLAGDRPPHRPALPVVHVRRAALRVPPPGERRPGSRDRRHGHRSRRRGQRAGGRRGSVPRVGGPAAEAGMSGPCPGRRGPGRDCPTSRRADPRPSAARRSAPRRPRRPASCCATGRRSASPAAGPRAGARS